MVCNAENFRNTTCVYCKILHFNAISLLLIACPITFQRTREQERRPADNEGASAVVEQDFEDLGVKTEVKDEVLEDWKAVS